MSKIALQADTGAEAVDEDKNEPEATGDKSADNARREALKRLGILGAYTAPAMLMLLHSRAGATIPASSGTTN